MLILAVLASRGIKKSNPTFNDLRSHRDSFSYPSLAWIAAGVPVGNGGIGCEEHAPSAAARPLYRIGTVCALFLFYSLKLDKNLQFLTNSSSISLSNHF